MSGTSFLMVQKEVWMCDCTWKREGDEVSVANINDRWIRVKDKGYSSFLPLFSWFGILKNNNLRENITYNSNKNIKYLEIKWTYKASMEKNIKL